MSTDETTKAVKCLEHYLFDVWQWDDLFKIARDRHTIAVYRERDEPDYFQDEREIDERLERHLAGCYRSAIDEVERALTDITRDEVLDALLDRMNSNLNALLGPNACYVEWESRNPDWPYPEQHDPHGNPIPDTEEGAQIFTVREMWTYVERDVAYYAGKVIQLIERLRTTRTLDVAPLSERITWKGNGAELAYLFQSLHAKDWISLPTHNGNPNFTAMARVLFAALDIRDGDEPMKLGSFIQACKLSGDSADRKDNRNWIFQIKPRQS